MARAVVKKVEEQQVVAMGPDLLALAQKDAGLGLSQEAEDNLVPIVRRLQGLSPQVNERNPTEYVPGARPGDIWLRDDTPAIIKGDKGFVFQPCAFYKDVVEWRPRAVGGGFVARHQSMPKDVKPTMDKDRGREVMTRGGNEFIDTRYHAGFIHHEDGRRSPYVIPMKSTDHTVSRAWMVRMNAKTLPDGSRAPSFLYLYRLTTKDRTNASGTWSTWQIADLGPITSMDDYHRGKELFEAFARGEKQIEEEDTHPSAPAEDVPF